MLLWPLLLIIGFALADVKIIAPTNSSTFTPSGGTVSIDIKWEDDDNDPYLSDMKWYSFRLDQGPNSGMDSLEYLKQNVNASSIKKTDGVYSLTVDIDSTAYGDGQYFIQIYAAITEDASENTIHYTPRFNLKNMEGTVLYTYSGLSAPPPVTDYTGTFPYQSQTGLTRTAPMQTQPATKMSATTWTRQFPTSALTYFTTLRANPKCHTTLTPGWGYTLTSGINYATAQPQPSKNGGWYNPQKRQSLSTRKLNVTSLLHLTS